MASISATASKGHHTFTLTVTETYVSGGADNYSNVSFNLVLAANGYDWYYGGTQVPVTYSVNINGQNYSGNIMQYVANTNATIVSGTQKIPHNADGTKKLAFSFAITSLIEASYLPGNASASGEMSLTFIARYATVTQSLKSRTETTLTIAWTSSAKINLLEYSKNNGSTWSSIQTSGTSGTYTISSLSADTSYNVKTRVRRADSGLKSTTSAAAYKTYSYPYATTMPNFTIGERVTINLFNPLGRTITVTFYGADGSVINTNETHYGLIAGYDTAAIKQRLYASIPNSPSGTYSIKVTYGSSNITKQGGTYKANSSVVAPSIAAVEYYDTRATTTTITGNDQVIIQNESFVQFDASGLSAQQGASIVSCVVKVENVSHAMTISGDSASVYGISISSTQNITATYIVTDSRGFTGSKSITVTMAAYSAPQAEYSVKRRSNYYSETDVSISPNVSLNNEWNPYKIYVTYKKTTDASYPAETQLVNTTSTTLILDNTYAWNVRIRISDKLETSYFYAFVAVGMPILFIDNDLRALGVNSFPTEIGEVIVDGEDLRRSMMMLSLSADQSATTSDYAEVPFDVVKSVGTKFTQSSSGIVIGAGVTKVKATARLSISTANAQGVRYLRIVKNDYSSANLANNTLDFTSQTLLASAWNNIVLASSILEVAEGDVIYLVYFTTNSDTIVGSTLGNRTSLLLEYVG